MVKVTWRVDEEWNRILANDPRETIVCHMSASCRNPEVMGDARLISAAPELLSALEAFMDAYDNESSCSHPEHLMAKAAIKKAKGETP